ncbi:MAG: hypothetical protein GC182_09085 [Rhodopseudomonas sp.]|nr:hypothetical protein [Rhodopseudomonas sp.]
MTSPESLDEVADRLELTRRALGYPTQASFATAAGMTPQKWNNYVSKRGDRIPIDKALLLCQRFGLSLDWIYRGDMGALPVRLAKEIEVLRAGETTNSIPRPKTA